MSMRLLSFLQSIEKSLQADDPEPQEGAWHNSRTINFQLGLARLALACRRGSEPAQGRGGILVQSFTLADGSLCLRATLSWVGHDGADEVVHSVYAEPKVDWEGAARRIAAAWLSGPPAAAKAEEPAEALAVAG